MPDRPPYSATRVLLTSKGSERPAVRPDQQSSTATLSTRGGAQRPPSRNDLPVVGLAAEDRLIRDRAVIAACHLSAHGWRAGPRSSRCRCGVVAGHAALAAAPGRSRRSTLGTSVGASHRGLVAAPQAVRAQAEDKRRQRAVGQPEEPPGALALVLDAIRAATRDEILRGKRSLCQTGYHVQRSTWHVVCQDRQALFSALHQRGDAMNRIISSALAVSAAAALLLTALTGPLGLQISFRRLHYWPVGLSNA